MDESHKHNVEQKKAIHKKYASYDSILKIRKACHEHRMVEVRRVVITIDWGVNKGVFSNARNVLYHDLCGYKMYLYVTIL